LFQQRKNSLLNPRAARQGRPFFFGLHGMTLVLSAVPERICRSDEPDNSLRSFAGALIFRHEKRTRLESYRVPEFLPFLGRNKNKHNNL
jgi:hypothetical protein